MTNKHLNNVAELDKFSSLTEEEMMGIEGGGVWASTGNIIKNMGAGAIIGGFTGGPAGACLGAITGFIKGYGEGPK